MYSPTPPPPVPPPKPKTSHDVSRLSTPASGTPPRPSPIPEGSLGSANGGRFSQVENSGLILAPSRAVATVPADPGDQWLPKVLEDKSKQDLADILGDPKLLQALTRAPTSAHPSVAASDEALLAALDENLALGKHLLELEARLVHQRSSAQAQLLSTHALERQWRQKQAEMDHALQPFAAPALYQQLTQSLQEQEMICQAMEESFLDGDGSGLATERETLDWVRKYREAKKLYYLRQERKERWNERRVGGWR